MSSGRKRSDGGITAWLVTWEHAGEHAKPQQRVAAILNCRWSPEHVREYVEFIFANSRYSLAEKAAYAKHPSHNPYRAEFGWLQGFRWTGQVVCGHNPWLEARRVDGLRVTIGSDGSESATWVERPKPEPKWLSDYAGGTPA